jgi:two-component system, LytTR family, response regulator LytT
METQLKKNDLTFDEYALEPFRSNGIGHVLKSFSREDLLSALERVFMNFFPEKYQVDIDEFLTKPTIPVSKKSFLVFAHNKYVTVATENIAFFYIRHESVIITCFDRKEYLVNHSLDYIQSLLTDRQFFRLNRQYLVNFKAVKEAEHYFSRKMFVQLVFPAPDKLLVSKEKVTDFLAWLDSR